MIAGLGLILGVILGLILQPTVPIWLQPYLPIAVVAALEVLDAARQSATERRTVSLPPCDTQRSDQGRLSE